MNRYICLSCSRFCYSSAGPESMRDNRCPYTGCKGTVVLARENQKCRICGCTWDNACEGGCHWVEPDLCSNCIEQEERA